MERNVAVIVETSNSYARGVLRGIHEYARTRHGWTLYLTEHGRHEFDKSFACNWKFDGVIARIRNRSNGAGHQGHGRTHGRRERRPPDPGHPLGRDRRRGDHAPRPRPPTGLRPAEFRLLRQLVDLAATELQAHTGAPRHH